MEKLFTLNHNGKTLYEIMELDHEKIKQEVENDVYGDIPFAVALLKVFGRKKPIGAVVSAILTGILDIDLHYNSQVVEYIVRTVSRNRREYILDALEYAIDDDKNPLSQLEELLASFGIKED